MGFVTVRNVWIRARAILKLSVTLVAFQLVAVGQAKAGERSPVSSPQLMGQSKILSQLPLRSLQQGNQVVFNGRTVGIPWSQWQPSETGASTRIGIADYGLTQLTGAELLDTRNFERQPVHWFSQATPTPLALATRLTPLFRYLDVTNFAQQAGWQMQVQGPVLQISSPLATILALRQGEQEWGDRLVVELDRPATWQSEPQSQEIVLTLEARLEPAVLQAFKSKVNSRVQAIQVEPLAGQTRIRLKFLGSLRPRVWSLSSPNRLVIDLRSDAPPDRDIQWAPGVRWRQQTLMLGSDRFPVVWLEVNPRQPGISLKPILPNPNQATGTAPLAQTAQLSQATAAINGGFFNRNNQLPLGAVRLDGRWRSGPILNRGAIGWNASGEFKLGRLTLKEALVTSGGDRLPLTHLNSGFVQAGIARYTADWGPTYTPLTDNEILVAVENNRVTRQQDAGIAGGTAASIPLNGYLLVLRASKTLVPTFTPGAILRLESATDPLEFNHYPQIVAAGPLLLQNLQVVLDPKAEQFSNAFAIERASRSAIGRTANGRVFLVTVHTRLNGPGPSLTEMAQLLQQLGLTDALNLDGGSSTTLYLGGQLLDRLPRTAARVHNGIGMFLQSN